jgi:hypothetical protein
MSSTTRISAHARGLSPVVRGDAERFAHVLKNVIGGYKTRTENLAALAAGVIAAPPGVIRLPQIARAGGTTAQALRRLLDSEEMDEAAIRLALVATVPAAELEAFVVESAWVDLVEGEPDGHSRHIFCLGAMSAVATTTIGWAIVDSPPPGAEPDPSLSALEAHAIVGLVSQAGGDYEKREPGALATSGVPPVVILESWFGTDHSLRAGLAAAVPEYLVAINGEDVLRNAVRSNPYETVDLDRRVQDLFDPLPEAGPAVSREILDGSPTRHGREYVTGARRAGEAAYAIARPYVPLPPGALLARLPDDRAAAIADLAASIGDSRTASRLRVSDFHHPTSRGVRRQALLASCFEAMCAGRMVEGDAGS